MEYTGRVSWLYFLVRHFDESPRLDFERGSANEDMGYAEEAADMAGGAEEAEGVQAALPANDNEDAELAEEMDELDAVEEDGTCL